MKRWKWAAIYALLTYIGFIVALNTTWEWQERKQG